MLKTRNHLSHTLPRLDTYPLNPEISVILVNWNTSLLLGQCLSLLIKQMEGLSYDLWVVDNGSTDDSIAMLAKSFPQVNIILNGRNMGFAAANNQAMRAAKGRYFLLINTDAFPRPNAIQALYYLAEFNARCGLVGARLVNVDGSFQGSYVDFPSLRQEFLMLTGLGRLFFGSWYPNHAPLEGESARVVDYVQGACMLVRREAYEQAGGLDQSYFMYSEEVDWCYAMRLASWEVWYQPDAVVTHLGSASSANRLTQRESDLYLSRLRFFKKRHGETAALLLQGMILGITSVKYVLHGLLRLVTFKRMGRRVVSPVRLLSELAKFQ